MICFPPWPAWRAAFIPTTIKEKTMSNTTSQDMNSTVAEQDVYLRDDERQPCEVWTRVMGYHRPVSSFNVGKQGEHAERRFFAEPR
jgi:hypothetical protein